MPENYPTKLAEVALALRSGQLEFEPYLNAVCDRIDAFEPQLQALLPEPKRRDRLLCEAAALEQRFPDPAHRPPLYGVLVGVKDIFRVDGFPTHAGSQLPHELFAGREASSVTALRAAGALILGKTVSTEFAYFEPGPTRNPHNLDHTPGGSSSGSAAAVAAGFCPLALGSQTVGSVIRPAAFCGIVGFKPSYGRIPTDGVIPFSASADHIGLFTQDVAGLQLVVALLCTAWQQPEMAPAPREGRGWSSQRGRPRGSEGEDAEPLPPTLPVLGVPTGAYLAQATPEALVAFEMQLARLTEAGYTLRHVPILNDIAELTHRHQALIFAEMATVHAEWFPAYAPLYRERTAAAIRTGQHISPDELAAARRSQGELRKVIETLMAQHSVDLWVTPAAPGAAPAGIQGTGDPAMNLPWTHAGMPTLTVPAGLAPNGLPLGLQCSTAFMTDERLIAWASPIAQLVAPRTRA